jgi:hypothetical protein
MTTSHRLTTTALALSIAAGTFALAQEPQPQSQPAKTREQTREAGSAIKDAGRETGRAAAEVGRTLGAVAKGVARGTVAAGRAMRSAVANELSAEEKSDGWALLFDGATLQGWRAYQSEAPPAGWEVKDGLLTRSGAGGDLMTVRQFDDFVLELDFRVSEGGNSGIMYRVTTDGEQPYHSGPEYQILDNARHRDAQNGPDRLTAANYALQAPSKDAGNPAGQWNNAQIVVQGNHVEHWLNGEKVVEYELHSAEWKAQVARSKFADWPIYGKATRGHIVLQDHGDLVEFRNVKIRELR